MSELNPSAASAGSEAAKAAHRASRPSSMGAKVPKSFREPLERTRLLKTVSLPLLYVNSYFKSRPYQAAFQDLKTYCLFIGHGRSGHSIVGALLDAHPQVVIPDELDSLRYVAAGFGKDQLCYLLLARAQAQARRGRKKMGLGGKIYSYQVPNQWQGRFDKLQVIGDSQAGVSTQRLAQNPALYRQLQARLAGMQIKVLHVVRNPFDNISTLMLRGGRSFDNATERYFTNCETIVKFRQNILSDDLLVMRQEDFLAEPQRRLQETCHFLGLTATQQYLDDCASILFKSPSLSRSKINWTPEMVTQVQQRIDEFDFLNGYTFDS